MALHEDCFLYVPRRLAMPACSEMTIGRSRHHQQLDVRSETSRPCLDSGARVPDPSGEENLAIVRKYAQLAHRRTLRSDERRSKLAGERLGEAHGALHIYSDFSGDRLPLLSSTLVRRHDEARPGERWRSMLNTKEPLCCDYQPISFLALEHMWSPIAIGRRETKRMKRRCGNVPPSVSTKGQTGNAKSEARCFSRRRIWFGALDPHFVVHPTDVR